MKDITWTFNTLLLIFLLSACNRQTGNKPAATQSDTIAMESPQPASKQNILFFGNSLTAGLGLESQQDAFPALIQGKIDSAGLQYQCINAGLSGETSAGGKERIDWLLKDSVAIFVLELGANDGLRGIAPAATYSNLAAIVDKVKKAYPDCKLVLAGMKVPPSMGDNYFKDFEAIFPKLAKEKNMTLVPFLLDKVAGNSSLNQQDGVHPTKEGQLILAHNVWSQLKEVL
ncbi:arylesterase [Sphingobacterium humi]|uniref:Arylesterase n=2 Tax=Sphingobacterium humi TaxID=1796905 RepID=A0A6N8KUH6_9SPHI|nr:arylesterase [Sphingobacterium humi]